MNLPNKLTMLRMLMIPLFIACFYLPESWLIGTLNGVPLLLKYVWEVPVPSSLQSHRF